MYSLNPVYSSDRPSLLLTIQANLNLDQSSDQTQSATVTVGVLVGLFVVMLMVTVLYHLIVAILKTCKMYDRTRENFDAL